MKKVLAILLALLMLTGCQLASEEKNESRMNDKLAGVFVTFEYLDGGFDLEQWLEDHPEALKGGDVTLDHAESMAYSQKIPVLMGENEWIVPDAAGLSMSHYHNGDYWTGFSTEGLCEVKSSINGSDNADSIKEEATIFVAMDDEVMVHANPVYQTPEGEYYTVPAMGLGGAVSIGGMSQSISEETSWNRDGEEYTFSAEYTIAVKGVNLAKALRLIQMNAEHRELTRTEFIPGQMPEVFTPEMDAAYLIVEEIGAGEPVRSLVQPGDSHITVYYKGETIWCLPDVMEILWNE